MIENYSNRHYIDSLKAIGQETPAPSSKNNYTLVIAVILALGVGTFIGYKYQQEKRKNKILGY